MEQNTVKLLFALLRSAIRGNLLKNNEKKLYFVDLIPEMLEMAKKHDLSHLIALALKVNELDYKDNSDIVKAAYRYEQLNYEYGKVCDALEDACIPFVPLKGSVLRRWYPEPWMRTSCDIDILVRNEHLEQAISYLVNTLGYTEHGRETHDVSLFSQSGKHIELHFDLVEEGRAGNAIDILKNVWENVTIKSGKEYWCEMSDEFFYFYHIAHMAKHFETGGCGIRPFIDLWILDNIEGADKSKRDKLLKKGGLLKFADTARRLSSCWLDGTAIDDIAAKMQSFILSGGVYGTTQNRVELQQTKKGGKIGYIFSRIFISYDRLKRYYPILGRYSWLMPIMQVRRWFMLLNPGVAKMVKSELTANMDIDKSDAEKMNRFLDEVGL